MMIAYIAGPYRPKHRQTLIENIRAAEQVAMKYWRMGFAVICPHLNSAFMDGIMPDQHFLDADIEILKRCDVLILMKGWDKSTGSCFEAETAAKLKKIIIRDGTIDEKDILPGLIARN